MGGRLRGDTDANDPIRFHCVDRFDRVVAAARRWLDLDAQPQAIDAALANLPGAPLQTPLAEVSRAFPSPASLAAAPLERIAELGIIRTRVGASQAIAQAWPEIAALLAPRARPEPLIERLYALPGIGPGTAHYIAMRALAWPDAFPPNDVAVLKACRRLFDTTTQRETDAHAHAHAHAHADAHAEAWQP